MLPVSMRAMEGGVDAEEIVFCVVWSTLVFLFTLLQLHELPLFINFCIPPPRQSSSEETTSSSEATDAFARPLLRRGTGAGAMVPLFLTNPRGCCFTWVLCLPSAARAAVLCRYPSF